MSDYAQWLAENDRYLADALADLRARLQRAAGRHEEPVAAAPHVADVPATATPQEPAAEQRHVSWLSRVFREHATPAVAPALPEAGASDTAAAEPAPAPILASTADASDAPPAFTPALQLLAQRLGLSDFERDVLLLCIGMELDTRMPALCAQAQHDMSKPWPTFALAFAVFDQPTWDAMAPERPLRYWRLLEIHQPGPQPLIGAALSADERIVNFAKGLNYIDDRLMPLLTPLGTDSLPPSQQAVADRLIDHLRHIPFGEPLPTVQLIGTDSTSKQAIAQTVAATFGAQAFRLSAQLLPPGTADQDALARLWRRESLLMSVALYVDASAVDATEAASGPVRRFLARTGGLLFVDTREPWNDSGAHVLGAEVARPTAMEQRTVWQHLLGEGADQHARQLSGHFDFNLGKIGQVAHTALAATGQRLEGLGEALWQGALARTRPALDQLAQRIDPKATWDDLKLPDTEKNLLHQIADQVAQRSTVYDDWGFRERMNRGLSISALFAGESGTGKTMAAEAIAHALSLSLYRIDLSAVVSKYIGETEKNLRMLFDAAEEGGTILFFDEADALFGKRSEVKDSHDRYANIEVNYLLQRLESFRGLAILATNQKGALDSAFLRRLRFVINFPFPGVAEREAIWSSVFPPQLAIGPLDVARLARLALTGGSIQGIALNAAFLAARAGVQITMPLILEAARAEFQKIGKPVNEADFRWLESAGGQA
ncbi:ATP-binding protein [Dyella lutea]|uniref:ATP-binding protein n=1 Tax=Dyella lutea TaxID=2950441 RepID=A0ABT1FCX8_9GAMM|nr:ATP-binding protein [Dyella lutea]MCP1375233.1 ATP-binding protein [Dyella lutea]